MKEIDHIEKITNNFFDAIASGIEKAKKQQAKEPIDITIDGYEEGTYWIHGDDKSIVFERMINGDEVDNGFELTWEEILDELKEGFSNTGNYPKGHPASISTKIKRNEEIK